MNLLNKLTIKNLKLNKKRTIVTVIGIILSTALITAVASMFFSAQESLLRFELKERGNYHYVFYDVPSKNLNDFKLNKKIEDISLVKPLGYAKLKEIKNEAKPYLHVNAFSKKALKNLGIKLIKGKLPQNENEIIISNHLRTNGQVKINVGDELTIAVGTRTIDGSVANQHNPYIEENNEKIENTTTKTYKVVGIIERPPLTFEPYSAPGYSIITYLDEKNITGDVSVYARYTQAGVLSHCKTTAGILGINPTEYEKTCKNYDYTSNAEYKNTLKEIEKAKYSYASNSRVVTLESGSTKDSFLIALRNAAMVVIGIIIVTSVFCIHNSFAISITEKTKQYGMLASIGATRKQIKKNVYTEALLLGLLGIPIGLLCGNLAAYILIIITNVFLKDVMNLVLVFKLSYLAIIFASILSLITLLLSARKSARRASKITPINAIRNSDDIKINKKKKIKTSKLIKRTFGIGGEIAHKNLERSKKKYRATVVSIAVCVTVFIALSAFISFAYDLIKVNYATLNYNVSVRYNFEDNIGLSEYVTEIYDLPNIKRITYATEGYLNVKKPNYSKEYLAATKKYNKSYYEDLISDSSKKGSILYAALDDETYSRYTKEINYNDKDKKNKAILLNTVYETYMLDDNKTKAFELEKYAYKAGDKISLQAFEYDANTDTEKTVGELTIEIGKTADIVPAGIIDVNYDAIIIMHKDAAKNLIPQNHSEVIYIDSSNPDKTTASLKEIFDNTNIYIENINENVKQMTSLITLVSIFLYGFITVIALIGITNIFNTITTNMNLRRREFAMLKSIGMTKKEFNRMIRLESIFYGTKALIFSIPIGTLLSYLIYTLLSDGDVIVKFCPPYIAIIISVLVVFLLLFFIMKYSINKIDKQNTIETIRNENI